LACSKVGTWDNNFAIQMNPWITNFLLLVISSHKSRVGACKARQWACPIFTSVLCGMVNGSFRRSIWRYNLSACGQW
jgi:hypothetical protein